MGVGRPILLRGGAMGKDGAGRKFGGSDGAGPAQRGSGDRSGSEAGGERISGDAPTMIATTTTTDHDWVKTVLFDRGYLARIRGDAIKVYLAIIEASGGRPDRSVTISLNHLMKRTKLSCPTVIESLGRLEDLGLVVSTTHERGKVKTYYVCDPPPVGAEVTP
jgi:hypothetical protein